MLKIYFFILILYSNAVIACPACWDRFQQEETIDFTKGNYPNKELTDGKMESGKEYKLGKDCKNGFKTVCDQRTKIKKLKIKKSPETP